MIFFIWTRRLQIKCGLKSIFNFKIFHQSISLYFSTLFIIQKLWRPNSHGPRTIIILKTSEYFLGFIEEYIQRTIVENTDELSKCNVLSVTMC